MSALNFACEFKDKAKHERYDRYCANIKQGKFDPYQGPKPDDMTEWEVRGEKAEFERAATQKSTISSILASRFQKAKFKDNETDVQLELTKAEKLHQEKIDAVKVNFFGPVTHQVYQWIPAKLACSRFDVPEPCPGMRQKGAEKEQRESRSTDTTVQSIFGG